MSQNRKYQRSIKLPARIRSEIGASKIICQEVYFAWKKDIDIKSKRGVLTQLEVRESIMAAKKELDPKAALRRRQVRL